MSSRSAGKLLRPIKMIEVNKSVAKMESFMVRAVPDFALEFIGVGER